MTARADISNARRKKLEKRLEERLEEVLKRYEPRKQVPSEGQVKALTAWEKGEAKPPFYREVLEEGVRRGDVVRPPEQLYFSERELWNEGDERVRAVLARLSRHREEAKALTGRIERAREWLTWATHRSYGADMALSILAGTEKERDG